MRIPVPTEYARMVREARAARLMSQVEFAALLGWAQGKVSRVEMGRTRPSLEDARTVAAALNEDRVAWETAVDLARSGVRDGRNLRLVAPGVVLAGRLREQATRLQGEVDRMLAWADELAPRKKGDGDA